MKFSRHGVGPVAALAALALLTGACSNKKDAADGVGADGVKTGPGVTDDKITVGGLTDQTGPYAALGVTSTQAQQLYFEQLNKAGGVCGRKIDFVIRDTAYDPQKAVTAYTELAPKVLGFSQIVGSPVLVALKDQITADKTPTMAIALSTALLGNKYIQIHGTTYDLEMINGVSFAASEFDLKKGDKVGHLFAEGEAGESALAGARHALGQLGLELVEQKAKSTDTDMTAQISALKAAGVKLVLVSVPVKAAASAVSVARASGLTVPIVGSSFAYTPSLLKTPAAPALLKDFYVISANPPVSSDLAPVKQFVADHKARFGGQPPDNGSIAGFAAVRIFGDVLKKACANKDLTRAGLVTALRSQKAYDSGFGYVADFTNPAEPATKASYVLKPDLNALGGAIVLKDAAVADMVKTYKIPVG